MPGLVQQEWIPNRGQREVDVNVVFVHGWSVTHTDTYGGLPMWLAKQPGFKVANIFLGKYISFVDTVTLDDIARAMDAALKEELGESPAPFACVTHSTGGPVARLWMALYHGDNPSACPLKHLVMLAPANHGSALAQLGKARLGRFKSLLAGIEPGVRVLDWLELGSDGSWDLNERWMKIVWVDAGVYPFVLTGQSIDRKFYDHVNAYTGEPGSDGVVRAAAANLNYGLIRLDQTGSGLAPGARPARSPRTAFGVLPGLSHSGDDMGIMGSMKPDDNGKHPSAKWLLKCLGVASKADYEAVADELDALTVQTQRDERKEVVSKLFGKKTYVTSRYSMVVFRMIDDRGEVLTDYDLLVTGGPNYSPDDLPSGFHIDHQRNRKNHGKLTYYLDYDVLRRGLNKAAMQGRIGFRLVARPTEGPEELSFYKPLEWRSDEAALADLLLPNETLMVEIKLDRLVDARVFRVENTLKSSKISQKPIGRTVI